MLHVIRSFGEDLPAACASSCQEAWSFFDPFLAKYGDNFDVSERSTRVFRHAITLFGRSTLSVAPAVLQRLSLSFEATGFPGYLWISGKLVTAFGIDKDSVLHAAILDVYERSTRKVEALLDEKTPGNIPDSECDPFTAPSPFLMADQVLEDYLQMLKQLIEHTPDIFFESSAFAATFRPLLAALTVVQTDVIWASLEVIRMILTHNCLELQTSPPPKFPVYASAISQAIEKQGFNLVTCLLSGLIGQFPEECISTVVTSFRVLATLWPEQLLQWLPAALQSLPTNAAPTQALTQFMNEVTRYMRNTFVGYNLS
jgi:transportin-3